MEQKKPLQPVKPDPFWPPGAKPSHLSPEQATPEVTKQFEEISGPIWHCSKCATTMNKSVMDDKLCHKCYQQQAQNSSLAKKVNSNWMEEATELGLALYERQPEETNVEWYIWEKYRSFYPMKLPSWNELAAACNASVTTVIKAATKWSYKVRLVAWAQFTDDSIKERRIQAVKEMNTKQLTMAKTIQDKLADAINCINPATLKPGEIVNLFKISTDLERKITTYVDEKVDSAIQDSKKMSKTITKPEDIGEIMAILQKAGALDGKSFGIEQTTRIVAVEKDE